MKRFHFRLERIRQWREKQVALEEARLEQLYSGKTLVEQRLALLEKEGRESAALVTCSNSMRSVELQAVDTFRRYVVAQRAVIANLLADCEGRIAAQRSKLVEARRKLELLDKLKDRKWQAWNIELAREIETQAGELFLAKWSAERR